MKERIQKILSNAGFGSRRKLEQIIKSGLVYINGKKIIITDKIQFKNIKNIIIDKKSYCFKNYKKSKIRVLLYHKPIGEICTHHDPKSRITVFNNLPSLINGKWINVGRLDINTSGLLLFTNSGDLANALMHPKFQLEREYQVRIFNYSKKNLNIELLTKGVMLKDGLAKFDLVQNISGIGKNKWFRVIISEGRNREVRRIWSSIHCIVNKLIRIRYGNIILPKSLKHKNWKELNNIEVRNLCKLARVHYD
ncbi:Ribosomal large subunit pseudouridine synthase B [Buchnera aphidicola (Eriosoma lanigerum)]|uniref:pseudouridine synthase n=1 Tax=Buchnera aphidicola TaxID=9 RepID=UPI00346395ED